jgi:hypothetical protein
LRYLQQGRRADFGLFCLSLFWNALSNMHYAVFSILLVGAVLALDPARYRWRDRISIYGRVAAGSFLAALLFLPVALMYQRAAALYGFEKTLAEAGFYSARLRDFLDAGPSRPYEWLTSKLADRRESLFPGLAALILATTGAVAPGAGLLGRVRNTALLLIGLGVLVALGTNTPLYSALYRVGGPLFHAIRVPARGVVLFHLGLAMLAALGLAAVRRRMRGRGVAALCALGVVAIMATEYAPIPLVIFWADARPAPVYRWMSRVPLRGSFIELPFGLDHDIEYVYRSPTHFRPIVNGYSGFFPKEYDVLNALFEKRPIPIQTWQEVTRLGATVVIYHADLLADSREVAYSELLRSGVASGLLSPLQTFDHSGRKDFVFGIGAPLSGLASPEQRAAARIEFDKYLATAAAQQVRPFGWIDLPVNGQVVSPGEAGLGWALARSGISTVRLATDLGRCGDVYYGGLHPGVAQAHPGFPDSDHAGFTFPIPSLPPGPHPLYLTLVGRDGSEATIVRWIRVRQQHR